MARTPDEQVKKIDKEINQLKMRKKKIHKEKQKEKKERTQRLVALGLLTEKYLGSEEDSLSNFELKLKEFSRYLD
jgi:hypothetical protein